MFKIYSNNRISRIDRAYCEVNFTPYNKSGCWKNHALENTPKGMFRAVQVESGLIVDCDNLKTLYKVVMSGKYSENEYDSWYWNKGE